ncbi:hypothetical protein [Hymenobacter bucti]|uniref:Uncharacterized protein n=1 Tax=Hymenobacter bucti TaxID=1844114 RepID=A0ABW4QR99_9BACT
MVGPSSVADSLATIYFATVGGVFVSVVLPLIRPLLPKPAVEAGLMAGPTFWEIARPYIATGLFSLIVALLLVASAYNTEHPFGYWYEAFVAGYLADSTLQKISTK